MTTNPGSSVHDRIQIRKWADECRATREELAPVGQDFAAGSLLQGRLMQEPPKKPQTVKGLLVWLACALVGIVFGLIVVAEMLGPRY